MPEGDNLLEHLSKEMKEHDKDIIDMLKEESDSYWLKAFVEYYGDFLKGITLIASGDSHEYVIDHVFSKEGYIYIKEPKGRESKLLALLQDTVIKISES